MDLFGRGTGIAHWMVEMFSEMPQVGTGPWMLMKLGDLSSGGKIMTPGEYLLVTLAEACTPFCILSMLMALH